MQVRITLPINLFLMICTFSGCWRESYLSSSLTRHYHIQPYKQKEGFVAVEASLIPNTPSRIVEIDTNGMLHYFPIPSGPLGTIITTTCLLNDSTAIAEFIDTANYKLSYLCVVDLRSGKTRLIGKDLEPVSVSVNGNHLVLVNETHEPGTVYTYSLEDTLEQLYMLLKMTGPPPVATADNGFLAMGSYWPQRNEEKPTYYYMRYGWVNKTFERDFFMGHTFATDDTGYVYVRQGTRGTDFGPVEKHNIGSATTMVLLDSIFVSKMIDMPTSDVLIFRGATHEEYRKEEEEIMRRIEEFKRNNPDAGCESRGPLGYWRAFDTRTKKHLRLDPAYDYETATRSGKYIIARDGSDRRNFSVLRTSEIIK